MLYNKRPVKNFTKITVTTTTVIIVVLTVVITPAEIKDSGFNEVNVTCFKGKR